MHIKKSKTLFPAEALTVDEIARIIQRHELGQRNDYNDMHAMIGELNRLRRILIRVNALNDSPSHFCKEVDDLTIEFADGEVNE
jgi:hypothetical protein